MYTHLCTLLIVPILTFLRSFFFSLTRRPPTSPLFPYTTLFRSLSATGNAPAAIDRLDPVHDPREIFADGQISPGQFFQRAQRSEEHTSELQSRLHLVCRLLLEKKKQKMKTETKHMKRASKMSIS